MGITQNHANIKQLSFFNDQFPFNFQSAGWRTVFIDYWKIGSLNENWQMKIENLNVSPLNKEH
jgi:hypothetical protein